MTPIFGDNMSPTGFGSVPCEKLEVLLDGERLELLDWQGGGRFGVPPPNCGAAAERRRRPRLRQPARGRRPQPQRGAQDDGPLQDDGRPARGRRDVPADELRAAARSRSALPARHAPDRTDAGLHVLPARRHRAHRRAVQRDATRRTRRAAGRSSCATQPAPPTKRRALGEIVTEPRRRARIRRPASTADVDLLMEFYTDGRKEADFDNGIEMVLARLLASPKFIYRIEAEPANAKPERAVSHQRSRSGVAPVVLPVEHGPRRRADDAREPGPAQGSGRARAAGPPHAEGSASRGAGGELRRPVAEPARPAERRARCR